MNVGASPPEILPALQTVSDRSLLIVEDDKAFLDRLARAMEARGFVVTTSETVADGVSRIGRAAPAFAVVDLRLSDGNGLDVVSALKSKFQFALSCPGVAI
jgi:two-component system response regulator RegA